MPLLIEYPKENNEIDEICPVCNKSKRMHTFTEIQICSKKFEKMSFLKC